MDSGWVLYILSIPLHDDHDAYSNGTFYAHFWGVERTQGGLERDSVQTLLAPEKSFLLLRAACCDPNACYTVRLAS
jgi:hypothetical protein